MFMGIIMVSNEEIKRRLELRRRGINPDELNNENEVTCSRCQTVNLKNAKFCIGCGNELNKLPSSELKINEVKSDSAVCPNCGTENKRDSKFCIGCGSSLLEAGAGAPEENEGEMNSLACPECGFENNLNSKFCIGCGNSLDGLQKSFNEENNEIHLNAEPEVLLDSENEGPYAEIEDIQDQNSEFSVLDEIKKAKELLDMGAISKGEYQKIKDKYLEMLS